MHDARLFERRALRLEAGAIVEADRARLRMQDDFTVAALARELNQAVEQRPADARAAHARQHRHAPDAPNAPGPRRVLEQATGAQCLAEAVVCHHMPRLCIRGVEFQGRRNALLGNEHRLAQRRRIPTQRVPAAAAHLDHRLAGFEGRQQFAQRCRHRLCGLAGRVGEDVNQFALH